MSRCVEYCILAIHTKLIICWLKTHTCLKFNQTINKRIVIKNFFKFPNRIKGWRVIFFLEDHWYKQGPLYWSPLPKKIRQGICITLASAVSLIHLFFPSTVAPTLPGLWPPSQEPNLTAAHLVLPWAPLTSTPRDFLSPAKTLDASDLFSDQVNATSKCEEVSNPW